MGKVEKIAVLSVLFLIAVILVVSMTADNPLQTAHAAVLGEKPPAAQAEPQKSAPDQAPGLLSATVTSAVPEAPPASPAALTIPSGSLLKTTEGLSAGFDSQRLLYTWQSNDSYVKVATKLYGVPAKFSLIQNANEGREDIQPGEKILVPVYDVENVAEAAEKPAAQKPVAADPKAAPLASSGRSHTVKKGESLWKIAKAELGDANRWKDIYELNKDKLKSPEALRDGMQLRLP
jgi:nucleoid-associated protein YgaU